MFTINKMEVKDILVDSYIGRLLLCIFWRIKKWNPKIVRIMSVRAYSKRYAIKYKCIEAEHLEKVVIYNNYKLGKKFADIPFQELYIAELENIYIIGKSDILFTDNHLLTDRIEDIVCSDWVIPVNCTPQLLLWDSNFRYAIVNECEYEEMDEAINLCYRFANNWWHFHAEIVSRLAYIENYNDYATWPLLIDEDVAKDESSMSLLQALNKNNHPVKIVKTGQKIKVKRMLQMSQQVVETIGNYSDGILDKSILQMYNIERSVAVRYIHDRVCREKVTIKNRKIFVARGKNDRLVNENEVADYLRSVGFEVLTMDGISFADEVKAFAEAEIIVTIYGATCADFVYCSRGAKIFVIALEEYCGPIADCNSIANAVGAEVYIINPIIEEGVEFGWKLLPKKKYRVDIRQLKELF